MKLNKWITLFVSMLLVPQMGHAITEKCPSVSAYKKIWVGSNADILPEDGMMPYKVTPAITDPVCQCSDDDCVTHPASGTWFVVTSIQTVAEKNKPAVKYIGFVVFKDSGCSLSSTQAINTAKTQVAALSNSTPVSSEPDFTNFNMGTDDAGKQFLFDLCLYSGNLRNPDAGNAVIPKGSSLPTHTNPNEDDGKFLNPNTGEFLIMADLSPINTSATIESLLPILNTELGTLTTAQIEKAIKH